MSRFVSHVPTLKGLILAAQINFAIVHFSRRHDVGLGMAYFRMIGKIIVKYEKRQHAMDEMVRLGQEMGDYE